MGTCEKGSHMKRHFCLRQLMFSLREHEEKRKILFCISRSRTTCGKSRYMKCFFSFPVSVHLEGFDTLLRKKIYTHPRRDERNHLALSWHHEAQIKLIYRGQDKSLGEPYIHTEAECYTHAAKGFMIRQSRE